jgi:hypothetical protein
MLYNNTINRMLTFVVGSYALQLVKMASHAIMYSMM